MRLDPVKVRAARGGVTQYQVAARMRRIDVAWATQRGWVQAVERGTIEPSEALCTALAATLGVGLSQLLPDDSPTPVRIAALQDDLNNCARDLRGIAEAMGVPALLDAAEVPW